MKLAPLDRRRAVSALIVLVFAAAWLPLRAQTESGALVPPGETPDLLMFSTGDVIGYLSPCG